MSDPKGWFGTVGQLRALLEGVPDDRRVMAQVVGEDGSAWNMWPRFTPLVHGGSIAVLTLSHSTLKTLPKISTDDA